MSLLGQLAAVMEESRVEYETLKETPAPVFRCLEQYFAQRDGTPGDRAHADGGTGMMRNGAALGDNLDFMRWLISERKMAGALDLIYIDPPFFSGANYEAEIRISAEKIKLPRMKQKAYGDTWENGMEDYLRMLAVRLLFMRDLLADTGGIWVHLDWHAAHYVKIIMDDIFGPENFVNEVIWTYKSGGVSSRRFARKHDTLLYYAKSGAYYFKTQKEKSYNRGFLPYRFKGVQEYEDEIGWYTLVNKKDVWQIDMVGRTASERTGYATQKPEALLAQILESCTREGDLCADFFCGSGTLAAAAQRLGRRWICCDSGKLAAAAVKKRMARQSADFDGWYSKEEWGHRIEDGGICVKAQLRRTDEGGAAAFCAEIESCGMPDIDELPLRRSQREHLRKLAQEEPLSLIDHWSVDFHYDGEVFRPQAVVLRNEGTLDLRAEWPLSGAELETLEKEWAGAGKEAGKERGARLAAVKVCDVFGGCKFGVTEIRS
ncbi:DNA methyltransferase [Bacilliculturomica massiliensis]|uniref:DNA methyltransferase n=1 Tax=Bacilliculturomica massiliensis TaxID=1917867 RepID=UPI00102F8179|nr:site-specific DNA-methyltransferase [Bacilliculturomica massiliensis]